MIAVLRNVVEVLRLPVEHRGHRVDPPIVIQIAEGHAAMRRRALERRARARAHVLKFAVSQIAQYGVGLLRLAQGHLRDIIQHVPARRQQVLPTVVVEIENPVRPARHWPRNGRPCPEIARDLREVARLAAVPEQRETYRPRSRSPRCRPSRRYPRPGNPRPCPTYRMPDSRIRHARLQRHLFEFFAAQIVKQHIRRVVVGYEHIHEPIMIVVGERHSHAFPADLADARGRRHIRKRTVAVVVIQACSAAAHSSWDGNKRAVFGLGPQKGSLLTSHLQ